MNENITNADCFNQNDPEDIHAAAGETMPSAAEADAENPVEEAAAATAPAAAGENETAGDTENGEMPPDPQTLIAALMAERDLLKDQLLRLRADFDNFRKRVLRETEQLRMTAARETIRSLLPVRDNLERALTHDPADGAAFANGLLMILRQFDEALTAQGLEPIEAEGQDFDPNVHEALTYAPSETVPAGQIAAVYERGYRLGGVLLRPARVVVSSGPLAGGNPTGSGDSPDAAGTAKPETAAHIEIEPSQIET